MKAAVLREVDTPLTIEDVQIDDPGPNEVVVRTVASGVCHSNLHYMEGKYSSPLPTVLGDEAAGIIEAVGSMVTYVKPGDHVITCLSVFCGVCDKCLSGHPNLCRSKGMERLPTEPPRLRQNGDIMHQFSFLSTFAEYMLVHENATCKIRKDVPLEEVALIGCAVTTGVGAALNTAKVAPGSTVAVLGLGGIGLSALQGAVLAGAERIIAIDTIETKLALARELGATDVIDASGGGTVEKVLMLSPRGVDYSFEAIGLKETAEQAYNMLDSGGLATVIGMIPEGTMIHIDGPSLLSERRIGGSSMGSNRFRIDMPRYIELYLQGRLKLKEMISQELSLDEVNKAFDDMKEGHLARTVLTFN